MKNGMSFVEPENFDIFLADVCYINYEADLELQHYNASPMTQYSPPEPEEIDIKSFDVKSITVNDNDAVDFFDMDKNRLYYYINKDELEAERKEYKKHRIKSKEYELQMNVAIPLSAKEVVEKYLSMNKITIESKYGSLDFVIVGGNKVNFNKFLVQNNNTIYSAIDESKLKKDLLVEWKNGQYDV